MVMTPTSSAAGGKPSVSEGGGPGDAGTMGQITSSSSSPSLTPATAQGRMNVTTTTPLTVSHAAAWINAFAGGVVGTAGNRSGSSTPTGRISDGSGMGNVTTALSSHPALMSFAAMSGEGQARIQQPPQPLQSHSHAMYFPERHPHQQTQQQQHTQIHPSQQQTQQQYQHQQHRHLHAQQQQQQQHQTREPHANHKGIGMQGSSSLGPLGSFQAQRSQTQLYHNHHQQPPHLQQHQQIHQRQQQLQHQQPQAQAPYSQQYPHILHKRSQSYSGVSNPNANTIHPNTPTTCATTTATTATTIPTPENTAFAGVHPDPHAHGTAPLYSQIQRRFSVHGGGVLMPVGASAGLGGGRPGGATGGLGINDPSAGSGGWGYKRTLQQQEQ
ncbi:hypothetical protein HK102_010496, partial [Quaeritorhiza haematococci]